MTTSQKLRIATDRNLMVYDVEAKVSTLTPRLVSLLKEVMLDNSMYSDPEDSVKGTAKLHTILITDKVKCNMFTNLNYDFCFTNGINIRNADIDLTKKFLLIGGNVVYGDEVVVLGIGINEDGKEEYLLGSC